MTSTVIGHAAVLIRAINYRTGIALTCPFGDA